MPPAELFYERKLQKKGSYEHMKQQAADCITPKIRTEELYLEDRFSSHWIAIIKPVQYT